MDFPDLDDHEVLEEAEGVEFYKDGDSVLISSEAIRNGEDSARISYEGLVNAIAELEEQYRDEE